MTTENNPQHHKTRVKQTFDLIANGYDSPVMRYFPFAANRLAALLKPHRGSRVLDVATGTGLVAMALAQMIEQLDTEQDGVQDSVNDSRQGRVQGIDISGKMLDKALVNIQQAGLSNIDLHNMDAEQLAFSGEYFDAASCAFGLFFLPDMLAGTKEIFRVLKPGASFITSTFNQSAFSPLIDLFQEHIQEFGVAVDLSAKLLSTEDDCRELLEKAGFSDIHCTIEQVGHHLSSSQDWWEIIYNTGLRSTLEQLDPAQQSAFRLRHLPEVAKLQQDDGIWLDVEVIFTSGRRPE